MRLKNKQAQEGVANYALSKDSGAYYLSRYVVAEFWSGEASYWFIRDGDRPPALEFMFDDRGYLSSMTVLLAGNVDVCSAPPALLSPLRQEEGIPSVDLSPWQKEKTNMLDEFSNVQAWWYGDQFWVVRASASPASYFDTYAGVFVVFDAQRNFVGMVLESMSEDRPLVQTSCDKEYNNPCPK